MVRNNYVLALLAVVALGLCKPPLVVAQVSTQGSVVHGTFGDRTLGQSFVPRPSTFGGGVQTGPGGSFLFLGRSDGSAAFVTPWRQNDTGVVVPGSAAQPPPNATILPPLPVPEYNSPELQIIPDLGPLVFPETNGREVTGPAEPAPGVGAPSTLGRGVGPLAARPQQPFARSPGLSDRLTQIARSKGILPGQGIDVYLSNNVALLHGTVRAPSDRLLLANILALEPEVRQVDNRLVAFGPTGSLAEASGGFQGQGHPGGGQQGIEKQGTGHTGTPYEARRSLGGTEDAGAGFSGGPITITNPATSKVTLSYTLDGTAYTIPPGYRQNLREDRAWVVQFSRGTNLGQARYSLQSGRYSFTSTDHGWELYRNELP